MSIQIAVAGKGGVGKTSFCALAIRYLVEKKGGPVLAVDADANANLNEALGLETDHQTISELISATKDIKGLPDGMSQETFIEYKLNAAMSESNDVDSLVMGGPDGPGCFCFPNNILRKYLDDLQKSYKYVVIDNEAGLEHIARKTTKDVDYLFVVSDGSARAVRSAGRVKELLSQIDTKVHKVGLILTRTTAEDAKRLGGEIEKTGLELWGIIPTDPALVEFDVQSKPLYELPEDSAAVAAVYDIMDKILV